MKLFKKTIDRKSKLEQTLAQISLKNQGSKGYGYQKHDQEETLRAFRNCLIECASQNLIILRIKTILHHV